MNRLIEIQNLKKYYKTPKGILHAVDDVSFAINEGSTVGVVGESGCGKTTLGRTVLQMIRPSAGHVFYRGEDITTFKRKKLGEIKSKLQIVFQDPYSSLDPRMYVEQLIGEPLKEQKLSKVEINNKILELMDLVGIPRRMIYAYPHEMNGGLRQRVVIARALALDPEFIVCDEPVSALDVSIQAQILNLLKDLQEMRGLTYMFISHDMSVVRYMSDTVVVMYLGQVVEYAEAEELFEHPLHPYTQALLNAIPNPAGTPGRQRKKKLTGEILSPINPPPGCRFASRCPFATEKCKQEQQLKMVAKDHYVLCCNINTYTNKEVKV